MEKQKLVMIGNGMAGVRAIEELLALSPNQYEISIFGAEPWGNYNRILLSPVLSGEQAFDEIILNDLNWYQENGITLYTNDPVIAIDREKQVVTSKTGRVVAYDKLIVATGSDPFILPIEGKDAKGVIAYRDYFDVEKMLDAAANKKHAVVIGGGLLGLEAANGLMMRGMDVTVVHLASWLLERQLDETAAGLLQSNLEARGLKFLLNTQTSTIHTNADGEVSAVSFKDGHTVSADIVVMAVGIRPNASLAEQAGLTCNRGLVVDDAMQTSDNHVYGVGECVSHRGIAYGLVAPLYEQAKVLANQLAGLGNAVYEGSVTSTKLKVTGVHLFSAGEFMGNEDCEFITLSDPMGGVYKKLVLQGEKLIGACLYGETEDGAWYFKLIKSGESVATIRDQLMFGESAIAGNVTSDNRAAAMADDAEVCGCNGVCKGTIVKAIQEKGLITIDEVKKHTKAASSCGSCTGLVEQILVNCVGSAADVKPKTEKPICACTEHNHATVRQAIREQHLTSIPQVMRYLNWQTEDGCATCRPALNYYLISTWPGEAKDDSQSRFINERVHANIQKDGTYSVVPRMWGGVTNPSELRRIADVADKYQIPMVKVTGGQRIDLLGVKKEDLPAVWRDLDMPSGHAYGKSLRTVKTCVGSEFCRFGTQNSTQMGIDLEKDLFGMWSPAKVKLAVSGCPRNCAESGIKDVGIIAVDSGWELYIGGNGGIKTEVAEFLVKVKTAEEVLAYSGAFLQLYREEAFYLERTVHFLHRVGMDYIKEQILNRHDNREALYERLKFALSFEKDPWQERTEEKVAEHEFAVLTV